MLMIARAAVRNTREVVHPMKFGMIARELAVLVESIILGRSRAGNDVYQERNVNSSHRQAKHVSKMPMADNFVEKGTLTSRQRQNELCHSSRALYSHPAEGTRKPVMIPLNEAS